MDFVLEEHFLFLFTLYYFASFIKLTMIMFQHVVFGICKMIDFLVPDVPEALELKIKRERYLAKQALADTDTIMKVCSVLIYILWHM